MAREILLLSLMTMAYCKDNATMIAYNVLARNTWLTGFNDCKHIPNFTMASADDIEYRKKIDIEFTSELGKYLPVWTYAFEVTQKSSGETFRIKSNDVLNNVNAYTCSNGDGMVTECCASLLNAQRHCKLKHTFNLDLPEIHPQTLNSFAQRSYTNSSRWGIIEDENEFLHESEDLSVRCLLLGENGKLWTDNCNERHRTLCIRDTTHAVFQYVGKSKIPRYTEWTTKRQTSDLISNTEFTTATVSIGEDTVPAKPGTGVSITVVIIVCISAVVLIILAVVLAILIMKKRSMIQETHHRRVKYVAEQPMTLPPTNNKAGDAYESVDERQDKEHSSGSPNTKGSAYKSLVERHNVEHSYRTLNTQMSRFELLDGTPNTQRMLMSHWMKDKMRNTALEHRPLQHVDSTSH